MDLQYHVRFNAVFNPIAHLTSAMTFAKDRDHACIVGNHRDTYVKAHGAAEISHRHVFIGPRWLDLPSFPLLAP